MKTNRREKIDYKYNEDNSLAEITAYINDTYSEHYSKNKYQATEFIIDSGHGTGFCIGNVMKYAQRYGRKGSRDDWKKDLLKVIHYAIIQLHVHEIENEKDNEVYFKFRYGRQFFIESSSLVEISLAYGDYE